MTHIARIATAATVGILLAAATFAEDVDRDDDRKKDEFYAALVEKVGEERAKEMFEMMQDAGAHGRGGPFGMRGGFGGFGGGPLLAFRYLTSMQQLNDYLAVLGSYEAMNPLFYPLKDGGGGTWRVTINDRLQVGFEYVGFGQSVLGFAVHQDPVTEPNLPNETVDEDGDGFDDYYSYAGYGQWTGAALAQVMLPVSELITLKAGVKAGLGHEGIGVSMSERTVLSTTLGVVAGNYSWDRFMLVGGGYAGLQVNLPGKHGSFRLGLEAGFDGHWGITEWMPATGVHHLTTAPPADFQSHNAWIWVGPQFSY